jgi:hypothetical protein
MSSFVRRLAASAVAVLCLVVLLPAAAHADGWVEDFQLAGFDGKIFSAVSHEGDLYVCGSFQHFEQQPLDHLARWDGAEWTDLGAGRWQDSGIPLDLVSTPHGLLIGGNFTATDDDGATVAGGLVLAGNQFLALDGAPADGELASAIEYDGQWLVSFGDGLYTLTESGLMPFADTGNHVTHLTLFAGDLYGVDELWGGHRLVRWNGAGWDQVAGFSSHSIDALAVWNDHLHVAGMWFNVDGTDVPGVVAYDGTTFATLGTGLRGMEGDIGNTKATMLLPLADRLLVGGTFERAGGEYRHNLAAWTGSAWEDAGFGGHELAGAVLHDGAYAVYGNISGAGNTGGGGLVWFDGVETWWPQDGLVGRGTGAGQGAWIRGFVEYQDQIVVAGQFWGIGSSGAANLAVWADDHWEPFPGGSPNGIVHSLVEWQGDLLIAGEFRRVGDEQIDVLARWDGQAWHAFGDWGYDDQVDEYQLLSDGTDLYLRSDLSELLRWDGATFQPFAPTGRYRVFDDQLYGLWNDAIQRWDGETWIHIADATTDNPITDFTLAAGQLWACGGFDTIGGVAAPRIARHDGASWQDSGFDPVLGYWMGEWFVPYFIYHLYPHEDGVVFAGEVPASGDVEHHGIGHLALDGTVTAYTGSHGSNVRTIARFASELWFGAFAGNASDGDAGTGIKVWRLGATPVVGPPRARFSLAAMPNPFNPATNLVFRLPAAGECEVAVFDLRGRQVRVLQKGRLPAGEHSVAWDGRDGHGRVMASGVYVARVRHEGDSSSIKLVLAK